MRDDNKSDRGDYDVGYGRPPRNTQFKKGERSPNPKGRPRGPRAPNLAKVLLAPVTVKIQGKARKLSFPEAYLQVIMEKALRGDLKAGQMLILLWNQLGILQQAEEVEDFQFSLKIGDSFPPDWIKTNAENNRSSRQSQR